MIIHTVLFRWRPNTKQEDIEEVMNDLRVLQGKVEGILELHCGKNFSQSSEEYTHILTVFLRDKVALENYRNHPDHLNIVKKISMIEDHSVGFDFEG